MKINSKTFLSPIFLSMGASSIQQDYKGGGGPEGGKSNKDSHLQWNFTLINMTVQTRDGSGRR